VSSDMHDENAVFHFLQRFQIEKYEENLATIQQDLELSQLQYKECHKQLLDTTQKLNDLKVQVRIII